MRSTSTARAFSGETYRTLRRSFGAGVGLPARRSRDHRKAARVLPDPVGAITRASRPDEIASQAPDCAGVGASNALENHALVGAEKPARPRWSGGSAALLMLTYPSSRSCLTPTAALGQHPCEWRLSIEEEIGERHRLAVGQQPVGVEGSRVEAELIVTG